VDRGDLDAGGPRQGLGGGALAVGIVLVGGSPRPGLSFSVHTGIWRP
jgi:hypothetical protein